VAESLAGRGAKVRAKATDVADPDQCAELVAFAQSELGNVDGLVNNAGIGSAQSSVKVDSEEFQQVIDTNLNGAFWMARECAKRMRAGSSIVNVASVLGLVAPRYPQAAYAASKSGVVGLTRALAQEWSRHRQIRVNALCPGYFRTEMTEGAIEELTSNVRSNSMLGRLGTIDELTPALIFLLGDASSYITGVSLCVDGGMSAL
jgi:NAD(P)-dependent dehydrogenase (short-subunit alcohol dehydrogenase family)